eukprot:gnl/TRDRNA2_/TRDRNA2_190025_c0_seq1.p1 gnl/TRDRNA2_/TRDRNA2_190025_c0~~gnl/TRDRNA2_/TRDRNA2_190025_c0_seq1.p1  ORF type:complete len:277 (-),score=41.04 gnl/TRDRNA2_/TRDRNA2_190025_c0_seq1:42-872(-)
MTRGVRFVVFLAAVVQTNAKWLGTASHSNKLADKLRMQPLRYAELPRASRPSLREPGARLPERGDWFSPYSAFRTLRSSLPTLHAEPELDAESPPDFETAYYDMINDQEVALTLVGTGGRGYSELGRGIVFATDLGDEYRFKYANLEQVESESEVSSSTDEALKADVVAKIKAYDPDKEVVVVFQREGDIGVNLVTPSVSPQEVAEIPEIKERIASIPIGAPDQELFAVKSAGSFVDYIVPSCFLLATLLIVTSGQKTFRSFLMPAQESQHSLLSA